MLIFPLSLLDHSLQQGARANAAQAVFTNRRAAVARREVAVAQAQAERRARRA